MSFGHAVKALIGGRDERVLKLKVMLQLGMVEGHVAMGAFHLRAGCTDDVSHSLDRLQHHLVGVHVVYWILTVTIHHHRMKLASVGLLLVELR